jgi:hypothetical protein
MHTATHICTFVKTAILTHNSQVPFPKIRHFERYVTYAVERTTLKPRNNKYKIFIINYQPETQLLKNRQNFFWPMKKQIKLPLLRDQPGQR